MKSKMHAIKMALIFILFLVFYSSNANAQTTAIPDTIFEQRLIQLGIDSDGLNGQILNSDAAGVTQLIIGYGLVLDLTGIAAFVDLEYLNCSQNSLTSLDMSGNPALEYLICSDNNLTSLDVSGNPVLEHLHSQYNSLTSLDVSGNLVLKDLRCEFNSLTSLNMNGSLALYNVVCNNNNLISLDVSGTPALRYLKCAHNNITSLDLTGNPLLEYLYSEYNDLLSLDVSVGTPLVTLSCSYNDLTSLDVSGNPALKNLQCSANDLTNLDVSNNPALEILYCGNNDLTNLDVSNNLILNNLSCWFNNLTNIDVSANLALTNFNCSVNNLTSLDLTANLALSDLFCNINNLIHLDLSTNVLLQKMYCQLNSPNLRICVPNFQVAINHSNWVKDVSAVYSEGCYLLAVEGQVVVDTNSNCIADSLEEGMIVQLLEFVRVSDTSTSYFTNNGPLGTYAAFLDTGTYVVNIIPQNSYWQGCPSSQQVTVDTSYTVQTLDWTLDPIVLCPNLSVDISAPMLRMTGGGSSYTVSYCNTGTIVALNAYVEVDLDPGLNFINSSIPVASQNGTVYTFNLDSIAVGDCGSFLIGVLVDTSVQFQQTHCTEAHIYPDSICSPIWSGPIVGGQTSCQGDTVFFYIENLGAAMLQPQPYSIIEDNIAMRIGTVLLGAGQSTVIAQVAAVGKTYRIEVQQSTGFPGVLGNTTYSSVIEGCHPFSNGDFNTGFVTQFSNGHSAPFLAVDCQQNVGSYDPNDKAAQPEGYGLAHYIEKNIALDYKVRFQNTGTDTAFNIIILDTISPYLDLSTLQMGASDHSYSWEIISGNILRVNFPDILLVDSNANEPLSHGFFRYRINQKANNPIGTVINNQAAIYFDYNLPIFTNTTFHTIGENFIVTALSIDEIYGEKIKVTAFPNPFTNYTTIQVEGKEYDELQLLVFDVMGRSVAQEKSSFSNQIELSRGNLQAGVYFYQLLGDDELISTGKVVVE